MIEIKTRTGRSFWVCEQSLELAKKFFWNVFTRPPSKPAHYIHHPYVFRDLWIPSGIPRVRGKTKKILFHRELLADELKKVSKNYFVDHINGNVLDNRIANLRIVSAAENARNRRKGTNTSSKFKGVTAHADNWIAQATYNGKHHYLGYFKSEVEAARAYDEFCKKNYGSVMLQNGV